jgi:hypothetical protein
MKFENLCKLSLNKLQEKVLNEDFGRYIIRVQLIDEDSGEVIQDTEINQYVSGDEAAWQKLQDIKNILESEEEISI